MASKVSGVCLQGCIGDLSISLQTGQKEQGSRDVFFTSQVLTPRVDFESFVACEVLGATFFRQPSSIIRSVHVEAGLAWTVLSVRAKVCMLVIPASCKGFGPRSASIALAGEES